MYINRLNLSFSQSGSNPVLYYCHILWPSISPSKLCIQHFIMYVQTVNSELQSRIENRNTCNYFSNCVSRDLVKLFTPFLNKKVRKISGYGGWLKSIENLIELWKDLGTIEIKITFDVFNLLELKTETDQDC